MTDSFEAEIEAVHERLFDSPPVSKVAKAAAVKVTEALDQQRQQGLLVGVDIL